MTEVCIFTEPQQGATYGDLLRVAQAAEELGFTGFFRSDHFLHMGSVTGLPGPPPARVTLGAALAGPPPPRRPAGPAGRGAEPHPAGHVGHGCHVPPPRSARHRRRPG